jgi:drug/metabolite transporter (DMT)-like permease
MMNIHKKIKRDGYSKARLALLLLALLFSLFGPMARAFSQEYTILQQVYIRTTIAWLLLGGYLMATKRLILKFTIPHSELWIVLVRSLFVFGGAVCFSLAVQHTSLSITGFLGALPFTVMWSWILFSKAPNGSEVYSVLVALFGLLLIFLPELAESTHISFVGSLCAFLSALMLSYGLAARKLHQYPWQESILVSVL